METEMLTMLIVGFIFSAICYRMARNRNRNPEFYVIFGFFFGLLTVIFLALAGKKYAPGE